MNFSTYFRQYLIFLLFLGFSITPQLYAQSKATISGDFPDPSVIFANGKYYSVGTSSEWAPHLPIYSSDDLNNWKQEGFVFNKTPDWIGSSFWAPEYFYQNGTYYMYYSAKRKSDGVSCIGVATSKYPDKGFVDHGIVVEYGTESIDAYVLRDGKDLYMTWKAYGLDKRPIEILGSRLSEDGLKLVGEPFSILQDTAKIGIEGQSFVQKDGYYYMFYSAGACCGPGCDYHVQAVRSKSIKGPYEDVGQAVLLGNNNNWKCMGHGTFVKDKKGDYYYLFHGYSNYGTIYTGRQGLLAKLEWSDKGDPVFDFVPDGNKLSDVNLNLNFKKLKESEFFGQWDFRVSHPQWILNNQGLTLSSTESKDNIIGTVLTWRPATRIYNLSSQIDLKSSSENALKGLAIYGDKNGALGVGVQEDKIKVWKAMGTEINTLKEFDLPINLNTIELKIQTNADLSVNAFYRIEKGDWITLELSPDMSYSIKDFAPWDRSPRPGIHLQGKENEKVVFWNFSLRYYKINSSAFKRVKTRIFAFGVYFLDRRYIVHLSLEFIQQYVTDPGKVLYSFYRCRYSLCIV